MKNRHAELTAALTLVSGGSGPMGSEMTRAPEWVMYVPGGWSNIQAKVDGEASAARVYVDPATAQVLQASLDAFRAEGGPQPFFDFDHDAEERAGSPQAFEWMDYSHGRKPGVYARWKYSAKGERAVVAGEGMEPEYSYFSPRCDFDPVSGIILGLMPRGTGLAAGGLVNDPAFETISALLGKKPAAQAALTQTETMHKNILAALAAHGLLSEAEAAQDNAHELLASRVQALKTEAEKSATELTAARTAAGELGTLRTELQAAKEKLAGHFVAELEASGKVAPLDDATKQQLRSQYLKDPTGTELLAKLMPARSVTPDGKVLTTALEAAATSAAKQGSKRLARTHELMASKRISYDAAWALAGEEKE